jgi:hypothetical protein
MTIKSLNNLYVTDNLALFDELPYELLTMWTVVGPATRVGPTQSVQVLVLRLHRGGSLLSVKNKNTQFLQKKHYFHMADSLSLTHTQTNKIRHLDIGCDFLVRTCPVKYDRRVSRRCLLNKLRTHKL